MTAVSAVAAACARMSEGDLRALYRYLMTLDPVENDVRVTLIRRYIVDLM